jgi:hypothetical protein
MKILAIVILVMFCGMAFGQTGLPYNKYGTVGTEWVVDTMKIGAANAPATARVSYTFSHDGGSAATDTVFIRFVKSNSDSGTGSNGRVTMLLGGQSIGFMLPIGQRIWYRKGSDSSVPYKMAAQVE